MMVLHGSFVFVAESVVSYGDGMSYIFVTGSVRGFFDSITKGSLCIPLETGVHVSLCVCGGWVGVLFDRR